MFCKLFGPDNDQIVAMLKTGNDGPEIVISYVPQGMGVCEMALKYPEAKYRTKENTSQEANDIAWTNAEKAFAKMDEAKLRATVRPVLDHFAGLLAAEEAKETEVK